MNITLIVFGTVLLIGGTILGFDNKFNLRGYVMISSLFLSGIFLLVGLSGDLYKQGQTDALTGKIQYKLVTQSDSSKIWVKINKDSE